MVILGIIAGALSQFPELWPFQIVPSFKPSLLLVGFLILPLIVLVFIWLWSYLARMTEHQVVLKFLSWILASIMLLYNLAFILLASYGPDPATLTGPGENLPQWMAMVRILLSPLYLTPPFCLFVIRPRMREIYKNSKWLHSLEKQVLLYIVAVLVYFLANGLVYTWIIQMS